MGPVARPSKVRPLPRPSAQAAELQQVENPVHDTARREVADTIPVRVTSESLIRQVISNSSGCVSASNSRLPATSRARRTASPDAASLTWLGIAPDAERCAVGQCTHATRSYRIGLDCGGSSQRRPHGSAAARGWTRRRRGTASSIFLASSLYPDRNDSSSSRDLGQIVAAVVCGTDGIGHVVPLSRGVRSRNSPVEDSHSGSVVTSEWPGYSQVRNPAALPRGDSRMLVTRRRCAPAGGDLASI